MSDFEMHRVENLKNIWRRYYIKKVDGIIRGTVDDFKTYGPTKS